jgi:hypothetical protein
LNWFSKGAIAALNEAAVCVVWVVWLGEDELADAREDELLVPLPPQPASSARVATIPASQGIQDLDLARRGPIARP